jgi:Zn finger protein HypA/HybF involved in hydrogenase expression
VIESVLYSLASIPLFAARPFLAAFLTAVLARWGVDMPFIGDSRVIIALHHSPAWFQSWACILSLLALAAAEYWATKDPDVRGFMEDLDSWIKSGVSLLVTLALIEKEDAALIQKLQSQGLAVADLWAGVVAVGTWITAWMRRGALALIYEIDDDDDIGLASVIGWTESAFTLIGVLFLIVFPILSLVLAGLTALGLFVAQAWVRRREERRKQPCERCAAPVYPHALRCPLCRHPQAAPRAVGVFGQPRAHACEDRQAQVWQLLARKRCPDCAARLKERAVQQSCKSCGTVSFATRREFEAYADAIDARLPRTLLVCALFSAIPVVGVIPGVIYYRLNLVTAFRGYLPPLTGCLTRFYVRVLHWGLLLFQPIPLVGAVILPLMCWSTHMLYRRALKNEVQTRLAEPAVL